MKSPQPKMNRSFRIARFAITAGAMLVTAAQAADTLVRDFEAPPQAARPYVWWHWLGYSINEQGVDRDIAAMKETGLGGALITNLSSLPSMGGARIENPPAPEMRYDTKPWWALMKRALAQGHAAGLDMGVVNCPGWAVSGGPWITAELSMQRLIWAETRITGGQRYTGQPARAKVSPRWDFYREVALLAVPDGESVAVEQVVDLTSRLQPDGTLDWETPPGNWKLYRFGHTTTGRMTNPLPDNYESLEVDKLSEAASVFHIEQLLQSLRDNLGPVIGKEVRHIHFDSYEAGPTDWTADFPAQFQAQHGYSLVPWLPVLAGRRIGGEQAARFEWDVRQTISDLFNYRHLAAMSRTLKAAGVRMSLEPYTGPFDTIAATEQVELPMTEFWSNPKSWLNTRMDRHDLITRSVAASGQGADARIVCAEALTGFPQDSQWTEDPAYLKPAIDWAMVSGVNQFQLHSWVQQPFGDAVKPGLTLSWWGTHFGRNQTWFKPGKDFFDYLSRCAAVLQHGAVVSDVCALGFVAEVGDSVSPAVFRQARVRDGRIVLPNGRSYALLLLPPDTQAMLPEVAEKLRELVAAGAAVLGPRPRFSPSLAGFPAADQTVARIGLEMWGKADGVHQTQNQFREGRVYTGIPVAEALAAEKVAPDFVVNLGNPAEIRALHRQDGQTDIYFVVHSGKEPVSAALSFRVKGKVPEIWLPKSGKRADAAFWGPQGDHTRVLLALEPDDAVFVVFRRNAAGENPVRVITRTAEFSGHHMIGHHYLPDNTFNQQSVDRLGPPVPGVSLVRDAAGNLRLRAARTGQYEITFADGKSARAAIQALPKAIELGGPWEVAFTSGLGQPGQAQFPILQSWTEHPDPAVKFFSGTGTYRKEVTVPPDALRNGVRAVLDLGAVRSLAQVKVNGQDLGVVWSQPFAVDVTAALRPGVNEVTIAVTNTWRNRLIGDEQLPSDTEWGEPRMFRRTIATGRPLKRYPDWLIQVQPRPVAERQTFVSWNYFNRDSALMPSGLLGPVQLRFESDVVIAMPKDP